MFDPKKLSPLPWSIVPANKSKRLRNVFCDALCMPLADKFASDDAEFFVMARKCFDIGERRGWYVCRETCVPQGYTPEWSVFFHRDEMPDVFWLTTRTQVEAMALMIEADEWLTKQETSEGNFDEC